MEIDDPDEHESLQAHVYHDPSQQSLYADVEHAHSKKKEKEHKEHKDNKQQQQQVDSQSLSSPSQASNNNNGKKVKESYTEMTELVHPHDMTPYHTLHSGKILEWMDKIGLLCVQKHTQSRVVSVSIDDVFFQSPIYSNEIVTLSAIVTRVFHSSIEVMVEVCSQDRWSDIKRLCCYSYLTYVAMNGQGESQAAPSAIAETEDEKQRWAQAPQRRSARLQHKLHLLQQLLTQHFEEWEQQQPKDNKNKSSTTSTVSTVSTASTTSTTVSTTSTVSHTPQN